MRNVSTTYAVRSVLRNARRTALSVVGIGIGCALALYVDSLIRGTAQLYVAMAAESGSGHLRVVPAEWPVNRDVDLRLADWRADLAAARALPGVRAAAPRARAQVLVAMGSHVLSVEMVGVDPAVEPSADRLVRRLAQGAYLSPGGTGEVVVGRAIADRLDAEVGDEILASVVGATGDIESAMFRITGLAATGSEDVDAGICHVTLEDLARLTGREGAGEVTLILDDWQAAETARAALAARVAGGDRVLTWPELSPEFEGHLRQDRATTRLVTAVIIVIVLLGVTSAQLAAVLERRKEFAVLAALGMKPPRMVRLVLQEALLLGLAGAAAGLAIALPFIAWAATAGLDFRQWMGSNYAFEGVILEPIVYADMGWWIVIEALVIALGATTVASLYPAWFATRTDPAAALRSAQ
ncbi:MAG TPA: FtsX-like permease family protein [Candidatus Eisenbacteria bacterium]|nr:FtsX-like permease family protein [Candidatus Eisenbacteria bacterium]